MLYPGCKALVIGCPIEENNNTEVELIRYFGTGEYVIRSEDEDYIYELHNSNPCWEVDQFMIGRDADGAHIKVPVVDQRYLVPLFDVDEPDTLEVDCGIFKQDYTCA